MEQSKHTIPGVPSLMWMVSHPGHGTRNMRGNSGEWYLFSSLMPRDPGHSTRNIRGNSGEFS